MNLSSAPVPSLSRRLLWLLLGGVVLLFAMGRNTFALAAWVAPVFLLRCTRTSPSKWIFVPLGLVMLGGWLFQMRGMVPLPLAGSLGVGLLCAVNGILPYALDRYANRAGGGFASTLVFPCALTAIDFSTSLSPYGSWGVLGYSQYGNLPLMQLAAVTGVYGISFLVAWLGPVVNWVWEHGFDRQSLRRAMPIFLGVVAGVHALGFVRLLWADPAKGHQRVAGLTGSLQWIFPNQSIQDRYWNGQTLSEAEMAPIKARLDEDHRRLLERSEREAKAGARLIFWSETVTSVVTADEPALIAEGAAFARRNHVYLGMAFSSQDFRRSKLHQNKVVLVGPDGTVLFQYLKSRPVPGWEQATTVVNGNPMGLAETALGRVGAFICFDLDFPILVRQAGRAGTDLVIAPSNDWAAIDPWHTHMAVFRAVENGFNLVRDVSHGRSIAVDYLGRTLAETDYFADGRHVIVSDLPTHGVRTVYAAVGDLFGWMCVGLLALLVSARIVRGARPVTRATTSPGRSDSDRSSAAASPG